MCVICFCCCPPRAACAVIGISQIFKHIALYVANNDYGILQAIAFASDEHSKIAMIILTVSGVFAALLLIYGAARRNSICLYLWIGISTLIITAYTIGLIYCAFVAKDKKADQQKSLWEGLKQLIAFSTYKKFFKRIIYYVTLIAIITVQIFVTFIVQDFTREMIIEGKLEELGKRDEANEKKHTSHGHHSHRRSRHHSHRRCRHHSHTRHPYHIRRLDNLHAPPVWFISTFSKSAQMIFPKTKTKIEFGCPNCPLEWKNIIAATNLAKRKVNIGITCLIRPL